MREYKRLSIVMIMKCTGHATQMEKTESHRVFSVGKPLGKQLPLE
jgi:hypothetical protein